MPKPPRQSIEQIVEEVGRYPAEAFVFVQEAIGVASHKVHGELREDEAAVAQWMSENELDLDALRELYQGGDLPEEIEQTLDRIGGPECMNRHVSGHELCWAIRDMALERWGLMARGVLSRWNITCTEDFGKIIFALVENDWLQKEPDDSIDDFNHVFSFSDVFDQKYKICP